MRNLGKAAEIKRNEVRSQQSTDEENDGKLEGELSNLSSDYFSN